MFGVEAGGKTSYHPILKILKSVLFTVQCTQCPIEHAFTFTFTFTLTLEFALTDIKAFKENFPQASTFHSVEGKLVDMYVYFDHPEYVFIFIYTCLQ